MPVAREPIVLAELVDEVAREYGPVAEQARRQLTVAVSTELPPAVGDRSLLKRVLGLPGEPRADKELPWSQVPRS